jgi:hypothetical protein
MVAFLVVVHLSVKNWAEVRGYAVLHAGSTDKCAKLIQVYHVKEKGKLWITSLVMVRFRAEGTPVIQSSPRCECE